jgi:hypothetical protein
MYILSIANINFPMNVLFVAKQKNHNVHIFSLSSSQFSSESQTKTMKQKQAANLFSRNIGWVLEIRPNPANTNWQE